MMIPPIVLLVLIPSIGFEKASNPARFLGLVVVGDRIVLGVKCRQSRCICSVSTSTAVNLNCIENAVVGCCLCVFLGWLYVP